MSCMGCTLRFVACAAPCTCMSYVADTFASCLTHPFPSEGDIACENDSSNLYVNPLDGSGGGGAGGSGADYSGVRRSASGDGSVLCAKGSQEEGSPRGSLASVGAHASRTSLPQPLVQDELASPPPLPPQPAQPCQTPQPPYTQHDDTKPKHRKARFQQVRTHARLPHPRSTAFHHLRNPGLYFIDLCTV